MKNNLPRVGSKWKHRRDGLPLVVRSYEEFNDKIYMEYFYLEDDAYASPVCELKWFYEWFERDRSAE
jgi:hypothetical protein